MLTIDSEIQASLEMDDEARTYFRERIRDKRRIFTLNDEAGVQLLVDMITGAKVFDKIDPEDTAANGARNYMIDVLDSMGLFSEKELPDILGYALSRPLPFRKENEQGNA